MVDSITEKGMCGDPITCKVWKQGHSIKCKKRGASAIRYWKPDGKRYWWSRFSEAFSDLQAEVYDFCRSCPHTN